ncbi:MAG: putative glucanase [Parcubacteria group bacterium]|nr:putative glucanase [Parcubacteria group bacterium]
MQQSKNIFGIAVVVLLILPGATHAALTRPLRIGSSGSDVLELQETLRTKGYFSYPVSTGFFGAVTKQAVVTYQAASGLEPVGSVGPLTRALLSSGGGAVASSGGGSTSGGVTPEPAPSSSPSAPAGTVPAITSSLDPGDTGTEVVTLQTLLRDKGFLTAAPSGTFDSNTVSAVIALQAANHLETVGHVGPQTRALLNRLLLESAASPSGTALDSGSGSVSSQGSVSSGTPESSGGISGGIASSGGGSPVPASSSSGSGNVSSGTVNASNTASTTTPNEASAPPPAPTVTFTTSTTTVSTNGSATFTWSSADASACVASGGWTGTKVASGTQVVSGIVRTQPYALACTGAGGTTTKSLTVTVVSAPIPATATTTPPVIVVPPVITSTSTTPSIPSTLSGNYPVYPGCEAPGTNYLRTIYFDAVNGNDTTADGSSAKPYKSFDLAVSAKKILPGDHVVLRPGSYTIKVKSGTQFANASRWTWIDFQPGATTPTMSITSAAKLIITGAEVPITTGIWMSMNNDLVIANANIYGMKDSSGWDVAAWKAAPSGINIADSKCVALLDSTFKNLRAGIGIQSVNMGKTAPANSTKTLIQGNTIQNFSADGMNANGSDIIVRNNHILDEYVSQAEGDGNHDDGLQIFGLGGQVFDNIDIEDNWFQDTTNPSRPYIGGMDGIALFDGLVTHAQVRRNVVITSVWHGISLYGAQDSVIDHNTVLNYTNNKRNVWIMVPKAKSAAWAPTGTVVSNNVGVSVYGDAAATFTNNIQTSATTTAFTTFDPAGNHYDLTPKPGGILDGKNVGAGGVNPVSSGVVAIGASSGSAPFTHQLALGSKGTEVSALQNVLQSLGLYTYPSITGYLGQATKDAVAAFQKQNQLAAVGTVGPKTRSLLNSIVKNLHLSH